MSKRDRKKSQPEFTIYKSDKDFDDMNMSSSLYMLDEVYDESADEIDTSFSLQSENEEDCDINNEETPFDLIGIATTQNKEAAPNNYHEEYDDQNKSNSKPKLDNDTLADILCAGYDFITIDDDLYYYNADLGYWVIIPEKDNLIGLRKLFSRNLRKYINRNSLYEIFQWLKADSENLQSSSLTERQNYINFRNGVLSLDTLELIDHRPDLYFQNIIPVDYIDDENISTGAYERFVNKVFDNDEKIIKNFDEFIGLVISPIRNLKLSWFLYGPSNTGKTVVLNMLKGLVGSNFTSALSFSQLSSEFATAQLNGRWLNISGEMSGVANRRLDIFKSLTGGDPVEACYKGKNHFSFTCNALLVFACNNYPQIEEQEVEFFSERIIVFPFNNIIPRKEWIPNLSEILLQDASYIVFRVVKGLLRLRKRNMKFKQTPAMLACKQSFIGDNNSFILFAKQHIKTDTSSQVSCSKIRRMYQAYCNIYDYTKVSDKVWPKTLSNMYTVNRTHITKGKEIDEEDLRYNSRGYQGIALVNTDELVADNYIL